MDVKKMAEIIIFFHDNEKEIKELAELFRNAEILMRYAEIAKIADFMRVKE